MTLLRPAARAALLARPSTPLLLRTILRQHHLQPATAVPSPPRLNRTSTLRRPYSSEAASSMSPAESSIAETLSTHESLSDPSTSVLVRDVSGGCGSMYAIDVTSPRFRGMNLLAQQRLVNRALGEQVKQWHGVQIRTSVPA